MINSYHWRAPGIGIPWIGWFTIAALAVPAGALGTRLTARRFILPAFGVMPVGLLLLPAADLLPPELRFPWVLPTYFFAWVGLCVYLVNVSPHIMAATTG